MTCNRATLGLCLTAAHVRFARLRGGQGRPRNHGPKKDGPNKGGPRKDGPRKDKAGKHQVGNRGRPGNIRHQGRKKK